MLQAHSGSESGDFRVDFEREPELHAIAQALEYAHLLIGVAGLILGASVGALLLFAGMPPLAASPALTLVLAAALGAALGLLFGNKGAEHAPRGADSRRRYHQYQ